MSSTIGYRCYQQRDVSFRWPKPTNLLLLYAEDLIFDLSNEDLTSKLSAIHPKINFTNQIQNAWKKFKLVQIICTKSSPVTKKCFSEDSPKNFAFHENDLRRESKILPKQQSRKKGSAG